MEFVKMKESPFQPHVMNCVYDFLKREGNLHLILCEADEDRVPSGLVIIYDFSDISDKAKMDRKLSRLAASIISMTPELCEDIDSSIACTVTKSIDGMYIGKRSIFMKEGVAWEIM